jgi:murein L,D-transpeptidase YafK
MLGKLASIVTVIFCLAFVGLVFLLPQKANGRATPAPPKLTTDIFVRIIKTDPNEPELRKGYIELFEERAGTFHLYKRFPICTWSGRLGPKLREGDGQSPEGFYFVNQNSLNPNSSYHLSFNLGFPNTFDRAHGRTGSFLMVHGECSSIGCYAIGNPGIETLYGEVEGALERGQPFVRVHIFPFPMTEQNLEMHEDDPNIEFWKNLKDGWNWFETKRIPPNVTVVDAAYVFSEDP